MSRINILCNLAFVYGFAAEAEMIDLPTEEVELKDKAELGALTELD